MNRFTKTSFIFGLLMVGVVIFLVGYLQIILLTYTDYGLIKEFPDSQSKFYDEGEYFVTDRKLTNTERDNVIFPNDELMYSFQVHNLKDYLTNIDYELEFLKGGAREGFVYSGSGQLKPKSNEIQVIKKIYLKTSGSHDVKLNLFFTNSTGEKYAQYSTGYEDIEILSRSEQLQIEQNDNFLKGVIVSAFIGAGTVTALVFSVKYSRKEVKHFEEQNKFAKKQIDLLKRQNQDLKEQTSIQNRPWISIADIEPRYSLKTNMLEINIKNFGKSPAHNIFARSLVSENKVVEKDLEVFDFADDFYSLAPNEIISIRLIVTPDEYKIGHGSLEPLYFGLELKYTYENDKTGKFLMLGSINEGKGFAMTQIKKVLE